MTLGSVCSKEVHELRKRLCLGDGPQKTQSQGIDRSLLVQKVGMALGEKFNHTGIRPYGLVRLSFHNEAPVKRGSCCARPPQLVAPPGSTTVAVKNTSHFVKHPMLHAFVCFLFNNFGLKKLAGKYRIMCCANPFEEQREFVIGWLCNRRRVGGQA